MPSKSEAQALDLARLRKAATERVLHELAVLESNCETICEYAGHVWADAGGGLLICEVCTAEKWEDRGDA